MHGQDPGASNCRIADRWLRAVATHRPAPRDASQPVLAQRARRLHMVAGPSTCPALTTGPPRSRPKRMLPDANRPAVAPELSARDGTGGIVGNRHDTQCRPGRPWFPSLRCLGRLVCTRQADWLTMFARMLFILARGSRIGVLGPGRALPDAASAGRGMQVAGPVISSDSDSRCGRPTRLRV